MAGTRDIISACGLGLCVHGVVAVKEINGETDVSHISADVKTQDYALVMLVHLHDISVKALQRTVADVDSLTLAVDDLGLFDVAAMHLANSRSFPFSACEPSS